MLVLATEMRAPDLEFEELGWQLNCLKIGSTLSSSHLEVNQTKNDKQLERKRSREVAYKFYDFPKKLAQDKLKRKFVNYKGKQTQDTDQLDPLLGTSTITEKITVYNKASFTFTFINEENDLKDKRVTKRIKLNVSKALAQLQRKWFTPNGSKL